MTDKELKKLSRLELLELLLVESRENERLREELEKIKQENVIMKSAQYLNETSEKLGTALQQASFIISSLNNITGVTVEDEKESASDGVNVSDKMNVIQEKQIVSETNEPEVAVEDKSDLSDDEVVENHKQSDISKRLDAALELVSSKIKEMDMLAGLVDGDKAASVLYNVDKN